MFVHCVTFCGLRSLLHSTTAACSVRVSSQAHPIMSYNHLVGIIMVGGHTENWSEPTTYSVQRNYRDLGNGATYVKPRIGDMLLLMLTLSFTFI